jgi:MFS family permease
LGQLFFVYLTRSPFYCALSRKYGKRPVFLVGGLFGIIGAAIGQGANTYEKLLAARIVQGFATSPYESLIIAAIGDMYFVHQRGIRLSLINFILGSASSFASIICGQITTGLGWIWLFHLLQIVSCTQWIFMFLFCPETTYNRDRSYDIDTIQEDKLVDLVETEQRREQTGEESSYIPGEKGDSAGAQRTSGSATPPRHVNVPKKKSFVQQLSVYNGKFTNDNVLLLVLSPFVTLLNVGAAWSTICSGLLSTWYVTSAIIQAGIFSGPPWSYNAAQIGYLSTGPFVGGLVGSLIIAFTTDPFAKWFTRLNKGI